MHKWRKLLTFPQNYGLIPFSGKIQARSENKKKAPKSGSLSNALFLKCSGTQD